MKYGFYTIIYLLISLSVNAQQNLEDFLNKSESHVGQCFTFELAQEVDEKDTIYLAIIPATFEYTQRKVLRQEMPINPLQKVVYDTVQVSHLYRPAFAEWRLQTDQALESCQSDRTFLANKSTTLCLSEVRERYIEFTKIVINQSMSPLEAGQLIRDSVFIGFLEKKEDSKIVRLQNKDEIIDLNQEVLSIPYSESSQVFEVMCSQQATDNLIRKIQRGLKNRGYDCEVTGVVDKKTQMAVLKYKKDNNYHICSRTDFQFLKDLGVHL